MSHSELISASRRLVVKVGSSLLIGGGVDGARSSWLASLAEDIASFRKNGASVIVVSSGAVALGRRHLGLKPSPRLDHKQAAAAAGQTLLMQAWEAAFAPHNIPTAQLLLTFEDTERRRRWLNARATIDVLLGQGAIPVINENDSVATDELRYGDNDRLSARVAQMVKADLLILLSDVDGLHTADPAKDPGAAHVPHVDDLDAVEAMAGPASGVGSGGMRSKLAAARIASGAGCATLIGSGREDHPLAALQAGARATLVSAKGSPAGAYKQWIAGTLQTAGTVTIDAGAVQALFDGRSLLPAGIIAVAGEFERGVCLAVLDPDGAELARGISAYNSDEARIVAGQASARFEALLGYSGPDALIHRDDLVMLGR